MTKEALFPITAYEHVGIRVSNAEEAVAFYGALGFEVTLNALNGPRSPALEMKNQQGVRIHLIVNALPGKETGNVLMDNPDQKFAGVTHPAFVVPDLDKAVEAVQSAGIRITDGPIEAERRRYFFIRDPDGTVLEFNEMVD